MNTHTSNCMLMECVVVRIVYYPSGGGFFPRFLKLSNLYRWAVTIFLLNHLSVFFGRISFPLQLLHRCTKKACYASLRHHCVRANSYQECLLSMQKSIPPIVPGPFQCAMKNHKSPASVLFSKSDLSYTCKNLAVHFIFRWNMLTESTFLFKFIFWGFTKDK